MDKHPITAILKYLETGIENELVADARIVGNKFPKHYIVTAKQDLNLSHGVCIVQFHNAPICCNSRQTLLNKIEQYSVCSRCFKRVAVDPTDIITTNYLYCIPELDLPVVNI
jgi:hypothetical protein